MTDTDIDGFWLARDYDRANADHAGGSRFADYVAIKRKFFSDCWEWDGPQTAHFAAAAWSIATPPVMAPGYVRCHHRILVHDVVRNDWDGSLLARVDVVAPRPGRLEPVRHPKIATAKPGDLSWLGSGIWRDWLTEGYNNVRYVYPSGEEQSSCGFATTTTSYQFPLQLDRFWRPPTTEPQLTVLVYEAGAAVDELIGQLNAWINPVLEALEA